MGFSLFELLKYIPSHLHASIFFGLLLFIGFSDPWLLFGPSSLLLFFFSPLLPFFCSSFLPNSLLISNFDIQSPLSNYFMFPGQFMLVSSSIHALLLLCNGMVPSLSQGSALLKRVRYCKSCKAYIKGFDHHCPAFGNCIGNSYLIHAISNVTYPSFC